MKAKHALCRGAGLRICDGCHRNADNFPGATVHPFQTWVNATTTHRCAYWLAKPAPRPQTKGGAA